MCPKSRVFLALLFLFAGIIHAQTTNTGSIRGSVVQPDGSPLVGAVKVTLKVLRGDQIIAYTDNTGRFEFSGVPQGDYALEADSDRDRSFDPGSERVGVRRGIATFVTVYLKEKKVESTSGGDKSVSVGMLNQKVPAKAEKEFEAATRFSAEGNATESIAALRRAIAIYPDYLMAHNDLGAQLLEQGKLDEAATELRIAIKIDPKAANPQINLGIVLERQKNFAESLAVLDTALSLDPTSPAAHLYAGIDSVKLNDIVRGEKELKTAHELGGSSYAIALLHLGQLYMKKGERELAIQAFESYLIESPNAANAAQVKQLIGKLR
jgi:Tfp pilus assembly protein PilF